MEEHTYQWYNNGEVNHKVYADENIPEGFTKGKLRNGTATDRKAKAWLHFWPEGQGAPRPRICSPPYQSRFEERRSQEIRTLEH